MKISRRQTQIEVVADFRRLRFGLLVSCEPFRRFVDLDLKKLPDDATIAALSKAVWCEVCGEPGKVSLTGPGL